MTAQQVLQELSQLIDKNKIPVYERFFKTAPGEYGEGDVFWGITVPKQRLLAKKFKDLSLSELGELLRSEVHEARLTALIICTLQYPKAEEQKKKALFDFYFDNIDHINNWDLVDISAPKIVGRYMQEYPETRKKLYELVKSNNMWHRRVAMLTTFTFIRDTDFKDALEIARLLLNDTHDLIHKAVGWMLREIGKQDQEVEEEFLREHYKTMPRTMLRYAIEKFDPEKRAFYLTKS